LTLHRVELSDFGVELLNAPRQSDQYPSGALAGIDEVGGPVSGGSLDRCGQ
jgi:hypothetical protein